MYVCSAFVKWWKICVDFTNFKFSFDFLVFRLDGHIIPHRFHMRTRDPPVHTWPHIDPSHFDKVPSSTSESGSELTNPGHPSSPWAARQCILPLIEVNWGIRADKENRCGLAIRPFVSVVKSAFRVSLKPFDLVRLRITVHANMNQFKIVYKWADLACEPSTFLIFFWILNWYDKIRPLICKIFGGPSRFSTIPYRFSRVMIRAYYDSTGPYLWTKL